jgi:pimeloyl-ACP methyl ester carboxylesterase
MPEVTVEGGVTLHWEERGSGPTVLLTPYWAMHPSVFDPIEAVLVEEGFRTVRFDERGTGQSDRTGPYDIATGASDLRAVCDALGPVEVAICLIDSANRAVRVAESDPELLRSVFCVGAAPVGVGAFRDSESLLSSETVVRTYLHQLEADYRGAIRAALSGANTQLSDAEVRERVQIQMDYIEAEAAAVRAREWAHDTGAEEPGRAIGSRLSVCLSETMGGQGSWFPSLEEMEPVTREAFPEAQILFAPDGIVSAPREIVEAVKQSLAGVTEAQTYHPGS